MQWGTRGRWIWRGEGEAQEPRRVWGRVGRGNRRGAAWRPYPLVVAGERVRRGRTPVLTLVGGTVKWRERPGEWAGSAGWARWAGLAASWAAWSRGGPFLSFSFCLLLLYFLFFSFSVLFNLGHFKYFINLCLLHLNYLCHIWHYPNIFVSTFENFCCLTYFEFDF